MRHFHAPNYGQVSVKRTHTHIYTHADTDTENKQQTEAQIAGCSFALRCCLAASRFNAPATRNFGLSSEANKIFTHSHTHTRALHARRNLNRTQLITLTKVAAYANRR